MQRNVPFIVCVCVSVTIDAHTLHLYIMLRFQRHATTHLPASARVSGHGHTHAISPEAH